MTNENQPNIQPSDSRSKWDILKDDPELVQFFREIQDIEVTSPGFIFTIPAISNRILPYTPEEDHLLRDTRVFVLVSRLVSMGIMKAKLDKTVVFGDALPTYELPVLE